MIYTNTFWWYITIILAFNFSFPNRTFHLNKAVANNYRQNHTKEQTTFAVREKLTRTPQIFIVDNYAVWIAWKMDDLDEILQNVFSMKKNCNLPSRQLNWSYFNEVPSAFKDDWVDVEPVRFFSRACSMIQEENQRVLYLTYTLYKEKQMVHWLQYFAKNRLMQSCYVVAWHPIRVVVHTVGPRIKRKEGGGWFFKRTVGYWSMWLYSFGRLIGQV